MRRTPQLLYRILRPTKDVSNAYCKHPFLSYSIACQIHLRVVFSNNDNKKLLDTMFLEKNVISIGTKKILNNLF